MTVNFMRHALTEYDESLEELAGRIGMHQAMALIRKPGQGFDRRQLSRICRSVQAADAARHGEAQNATG